MSQRYQVICSSFPAFVTITIIDCVDLFIKPTYFKILDWKKSSYAIYEEENLGIPSVKVHPLW
jgi:hypothetical protein